jgi:hypothetical protein
MFLDRAVIRRPLRKETNFVMCCASFTGGYCGSFTTSRLSPDCGFSETFLRWASSGTVEHKLNYINNASFHLTVLAWFPRSIFVVEHLNVWKQYIGHAVNCQCLD